MSNRTSKTNHNSATVLPFEQSYPGGGAEGDIQPSSNIEPSSEEDKPLLQELGIDFNDIMKVSHCKILLAYTIIFRLSSSHLCKKTMAVLHPKAALDVNTLRGGDLAGMLTACVLSFRCFA